MKTIYKYFTGAALGGLVCLALALPANAQHRGGGNSGGGGSHVSGGGGGGGGFHAAAPSGGSGFRPSVGAGFHQASPQSNSGFHSFAPQGNGGFHPNYRPSVGVARPSASYGQQGGNFQPRGYQGNNAYRGNVGARAGIATSPRPYVQGNIPSYNYGNRGVGAHGYYGGRGGWGNRGNFHYYHGYYNTYYLPRLGFSCGYLPYGYYPFYWGDEQYFYSGGLYYTYNDSQYTVVEPPVGAEIGTLPSNAQSIVINGQQYYEANGVYYQAVVKDDGTTTYQIAGKDGELNTNDGGNVNTEQAPQIGDIVQNLPQDVRKIRLNGEKYYVSQDGYYYQETSDSAGNKVYKIVGTPSDEPNQ
jgi:hypothetical protein